MWRELVDIRPDEAQPGYKHFFIRPSPSGDLTWVQGRDDSIRGPIVSEWKIDDDHFQLHVQIPANTTATVHVPAKSAEAINEAGGSVTSSEGVKFVRMEDDAAVFEVGSGRYNFHTDVGP